MKKLIALLILLSAPLAWAFSPAIQAVLSQSAAGGGGGTSYSNTGGQGNRSAIIVVTEFAGLTGGAGPGELVDGDSSNSSWFMDVSAATKDITFDFGVGHAVVIDEAKFIQSGTNSHGVWKWRGSNNGSSWTDIGSTFTLGGYTIQTITTLSGNSTAYRYYQIFGDSGDASSTPFIYEMEFKISGY